MSKCKQCENPMLKGIHTCELRRPVRKPPVEHKMLRLGSLGVSQRVYSHPGEVYLLESEVMERIADMRKDLHAVTHMVRRLTGKVYP